MQKTSGLVGDHKRELTPLGLAGQVYQFNDYTRVEGDGDGLRVHEDMIPKKWEQKIYQEVISRIWDRHL